MWVSSDKSVCNASYSNTAEQEGIAADLRYQTDCHMFIFPQACLLFPLSSQPKDDSKVCFSKLNWASF